MRERVNERKNGKIEVCREREIKKEWEEKEERGSVEGGGERMMRDRAWEREKERWEGDREKEKEKRREKKRESRGQREKKRELLAVEIFNIHSCLSAISNHWEKEASEICVTNNTATHLCLQVNAI